MRQLLKRFVSVCLVGISVGTAAPQSRKSPSVTIRRGGKLVDVVPSQYEGGAWLRGSFDPEAGATYTGTGVRLVDPKGFEGILIGRNGDYAIPEALKQTIITSPTIRQCVAAADDARRGFNVYREILVTRAVEVFGNPLITAERCATMAAVSGTSQAEASSGTFVFHHQFRWELTKPFSEDQERLIGRVWKASFSGTKPEAMPATQVMEGDFHHSELATALLNGCVSGDEAAAGFLRNTLQGKGIAPRRSVKLEMARSEPRAVLLHLSDDLPNALSVEFALWDKGIDAVRADPEKNVEGEIIGYTLYLVEGPLIRYVTSYFHGELCGGR